MDLLRQYIEDINHEVLTPEEEKELLKKVANGDLEARQKMIKSNLRLVISFLKNIKYKKENVMDIIQDGNIGLMRAVDKFDLKFNVRFSTYAIYWIRQAIYKNLNNNRLIHIPDNVLTRRRNITRAEDELIIKLKREPTDKEIVLKTGYTLKQVRDNRLHMKPILSLNYMIRTGETIDLIDGGISIDVGNEGLKELIAAMSKVGERDIEIIKRRFGIGMNCQTLSKIGNDLGLSRERVRQIENRTIEELRNILNKNAISV